jgi:hypothetical protein
MPIKPQKPDLATWASALPIPGVLRLNCLRIRRRKPGAALDQLLMSTIYFAEETLPHAEEQVGTSDY